MVSIYCSASPWTVHQAEVYIRQIQQCIETVAARPSLGRRCDDIRPGYFVYRAGSHLLFYRINDVGIDIVRILHQKMDPQRHF